MASPLPSQPRRAMMSEHGGKTYRPWDPQRYQHEAHSPASKLPESDLVFFLLDAGAKLDVSRFYAPYEQETRGAPPRSEEHTSELQSLAYLVCRLLLEKKNKDELLPIPIDITTAIDVFEQ